MKNHNWLFTTLELTEQVNTAKEVFIAGLITEGVISKEQADAMNEYAIAVNPKGFFGSLFDKLFKATSECIYTTVKVIKYKNYYKDEIENGENTNNS